MVKEGESENETRKGTGLQEEIEREGRGLLKESES